MVTAPGPAAERVVARPGDGWEGCEDAVAKHDAAFNDPRETRNRLPVVLEALLELGIAQPIQQQDVHPVRLSGLVIERLLDDLPVLPLQIDVRRHAALARGAAAGVFPVDQRQAEELRER